MSVCAHKKNTNIGDEKMSIDTVKKTGRTTKDADPEFTREWVAWRQALPAHGPRRTA